MKKFLIVANWKLHGNINMISNFFEYMKLYTSMDLEQNIVIAPPTVYLERIYKKIEKTNIVLGAQNVDINIEGSFTGETSISMLKEIGVRYVIVGHSERRLWHHENSELIAKKIYLIKKFNLIPILCIGETKEDKKNNATKKTIIKQLNDIIAVLGSSVFQNIVIAYEPIWAIGTGLASDPKTTQLIHEFIKNYIRTYDSAISNVLVQYGGSVNPKNAKLFISQPDIDGLLVGSASLNPKEFLKIIQIAYNIYKSKNI